MTKQEQLKELRTLTGSGMKDCSDALKESGDDIQKAVDILKSKNKNIVSGREAKVASEGIIVAFPSDGVPAMFGNCIMVEINCNTDFTARSPEFVKFAEHVLYSIFRKTNKNKQFSSSDVEEEKLKLISLIKENISIRRWHVEKPFDPSNGSVQKVFHYVHTGSKLATILVLEGEFSSDFDKFDKLGNDLAMQVAAMNPLVVSPDQLDEDTVNRQKAIFEVQLKELNKPQASWPKIMEGKMNKWYTEVCLVKQESVMVPKTSVEKLLGNNKVVKFMRWQVGEGLVKEQNNDFAIEVEKLSGVPTAPCPTREKGVCIGHTHSK